MKDRDRAAKQKFVAFLDCKDSVRFTLKDICAINEADAEQKAKDAIKGQYGCDDDCKLLVNARVTRKGKPCVLNIESGKMGTLYDVLVLLDCR